MKRLFTILLFFVPGFVCATHIVGGEFRLIHKQGFLYELRLIQYFDEVNGDPEAEDDFASVYIFRKSDDVNLEILNVNQVSSSFVPYTNPSCTDDSILFRQIVYSAEVTLPPSQFSDPEGYYAVFERCCRNNIVNNIVEPESTGQTYYMEFPPVSINNTAFVNSSPELSSPISDYACINQNFTYNFGATDADGDSLVYSMAVPLNSSQFQPVPTPSPAPHQPVIFSEGIGVNNMVPGQPPLSIDQKGKLTVVPDELGVFVFGIKVEEYRGGIKIGEVRRDYQLLVVDCNPGASPEVLLKHDGKIYDQTTTLNIPKSSDRCLEVLVTDRDPNELLRIEAEGVNFNANLSELISPSLQLKEDAGDTIRFSLCLPECPYTKEAMQINIIAYDNACSQPLSDTIRVNVSLEGAAGNAPFIERNPNVVEVELQEGESYSYVLRGLDEDKDLLQLNLEADNFSPAEYGMVLEERLLIPGEVQKVLKWTPKCELLDLSNSNEFEVEAVLTENRDCPSSLSDKLKFRFTVIPADNERPKISLIGQQEREISIRIDETLSFDVLAEDFDNDLINLTAVGDGFEFDTYNIYFPDNQGIKEVRSPFSWRLSCNSIDLEEKSSFKITFLAEDGKSCGQTSVDSLSLVVNVLPPLNEAPELFIRDTEAGDTLTSIVNRNIFFDVVSNDRDNDIITLRLAKAVFNDSIVDTEVVNFNFFPVVGRGNVGRQFRWRPPCETVRGRGQESYLELYFTAVDSKCFNNKNDTISIVLHIVDEPLNLEAYQPHNAITPNGDQQGDYFFLRFCNQPDGECDLPIGNCNNIFQRIDIFNRWGKEVFSSNDPEFKWYAEGMPAGVYYYTLYYNSYSYKGQIYVFLQLPD